MGEEHLSTRLHDAREARVLQSLDRGQKQTRCSAGGLEFVKRIYKFEEVYKEQDLSADERKAMRELEVEPIFKELKSSRPFSKISAKS